MTWTPRIFLGLSPLFLALTALLGWATTAAADPKPLPKPEQAKVDRAVEKGVTYLKRMQTKEGYWAARPFHERYFVGQCALCAYALLESGAQAEDPAIRKAAAYVRRGTSQTAKTYEVSLAILFLDRLGDPKDKRLIQRLALRLIAGQFRTGGWSYDCPILKGEQEAILLKSLEELSKGVEAETQFADAIAKLDLPPRLARLTVFQDPQTLPWREVQNPPGSKVSVPLVGVTDNSNTQFALLALWAAQRHGVPMRPTFRILVERFEKTQVVSGDWPYLFATDKAAWVWRSMTCVGLLALAIGRGEKLSPSGALPAGREDLRVLRGLAALHQGIGAHSGSMEMQTPFEDVYFLWSLERVGMLYNLPTLGDKEWYRWGAEILVTNQNRNGSWPGIVPRVDNAFPVEYGPVLCTAFALLFLKHSHPMKDLTPKLPFTPKELNDGIARLRPSDKPREPKKDPSSGSRKVER